MTLEDKRITEDEEWLSSDHMSAINKFLRKHCVSVNGLQDTTCSNAFLVGKVSNQCLHHQQLYIREVTITELHLFNMKKMAQSICLIVCREKVPSLLEMITQKYNWHKYMVIVVMRCALSYLKYNKILALTVNFSL